MNKNIIIALLVGLLIGTNLPRADADVPVISRRDLYTAATMIGILASPNWNPTNTKPQFFGTQQIQPSTTQLVKTYVDKLLEGQ